jgi:hypothetical protein
MIVWLHGSPAPGAWLKSVCFAQEIGLSWLPTVSFVFSEGAAAEEAGWLQVSGALLSLDLY